MENDQLAILQKAMLNTNANYGVRFIPNMGNGGIMDVSMHLGVKYNNEPLFYFTHQASFNVTDIQNPLLNFVPYFYSDVYYIAKKEEFLYTGIRNLRKNVKFLQLTNELANKKISDKEFEEEIETNADQYFIDIKPMTDPEDVIILHEIVNKIADDFSIDEAGDIFSFDAESIKNSFDQLSE